LPVILLKQIAAAIPSVTAGRKVCFCHKLAELSQVRPKNFHAQRCTCFTNTNLEYKQHSTYTNTCL